MIAALEGKRHPPEFWSRTHDVACLTGHSLLSSTTRSTAGEGLATGSGLTGSVAAPSAGTADPRHSYAHREVLRSAVRENCGGAFDRFEIVYAFIAGNRGARNRLTTERAEPDVFKHYPDRGLILAERAGANGEDWAGSAGIPATTGVMRKR